MIKVISAAAVVALSAGVAQAALLDFETGYTGAKTAIVGDEFESQFGVTFSSANGLNIVNVGGPVDGFVPNDTPATNNALGGFFLTSNFGQVTSLVIDYTVGVNAASFDVADIDGSGGNLEEFTFIARDSNNNVLQTQTVDGNNPLAGDAVVTRIGFSGLSGIISQIEISGTTSGGTRNIGIAFDNFNTTVDSLNPSPVPVPAALPMAIAGVGLLGALRARRKA